jgi:hypothetical protein
VTEQPTSPHRRRRRRATSAQGAPAARAETPADAPEPLPVEPAETAPARPKSSSPPAPPRRAKGPRDNTERSLRDLVGAGRSQLGVGGALRGRDVNRPTDDDLAEAEETLVIVRRNWQPTDKK